METGYILDRTQGGLIPSEWVAGVATRSKWTGSVKLAGVTHLPLTARRCSHCGYIELYAIAVAPVRKSDPNR